MVYGVAEGMLADPAAGDAAAAAALVGCVVSDFHHRLFERLAREQRVCTEFSGDNVDGRTNITPAMGLDKLIDGYRTIMQQIYSPRNYYQRVRHILEELKRPVATTPVDLQRILAFLDFGRHFAEACGDAGQLEVADTVETIVVIAPGHPVGQEVT